MYFKARSTGVRGPWLDDESEIPDRNVLGPLDPSPMNPGGMAAPIALLFFCLNSSLLAFKVGRFVRAITSPQAPFHDYDPIFYIIKIENVED